MSLDAAVQLGQDCARIVAESLAAFDLETQDGRVDAIRVFSTTSSSLRGRIDVDEQLWAILRGDGLGPVTTALIDAIRDALKFEPRDHPDALVPVSLALFDDEDRDDAAMADEARMAAEAGDGDADDDVGVVADVEAALPGSNSARSPDPEPVIDHECIVGEAMMSSAGDAPDGLAASEEMAISEHESEEPDAFVALLRERQPYDRAEDAETHEYVGDGEPHEHGGDGEPHAYEGEALESDAEIHVEPEGARGRAVRAERRAARAAGRRARRSRRWTSSVRSSLGRVRSSCAMAGPTSCSC